MLLVDPAKRANVEDICSHWYDIIIRFVCFFKQKQRHLFHHYNGDILYCDRWVNEGYGESCLEVAEELANQTPVRLDLLLSLVPPPESTETVVVSAKNDQTASTVSRNPFALRMIERWNKSVQQPNG